MARRRKRKQIDQTPKDIRIESLAHDGRGVGRDEEGKVCLLYTSPSPRD